MEPAENIQQIDQKIIRKDVLAVAEYSSILHSFVDVDQFINFCLDAILSLLHASSGSFFLWDERAKELILRSVRNDREEQMRGIKMKLNEGVTGWVADKGCWLLVKDMASDDRFANLRNNANRKYDTFSFLSLPLIAGNRLLGVINITEKINREPFVQDDLDSGKAFATHIALAYENLRTKKSFQIEQQGLEQKIENLERLLKQQADYVYVGKLASHLAHDLGNPIDATRRYVNLALSQLDENSPAREYLLKTKQGIKRTVRIIRGLLAYSRATGKTRFMKTEIHTLLDQALDLFAQDSKSHEIKIQKQYLGREIFVEENGLLAVFQNLFKNAFDAMNGTGDLGVGTIVNDDQVTVQIKDTGCGIPKHLADKVFDPFFTTKEEDEGTGIGLSICKEIVERCGGKIFFESKEGSGTVFTVTFPFERRNKNKP